MLEAALSTWRVGNCQGRVLVLWYSGPCALLRSPLWLPSSPQQLPHACAGFLGRRSFAFCFLLAQLPLSQSWSAGNFLKAKITLSNLRDLSTACLDSQACCMVTPTGSTAFVTDESLVGRPDDPIRTAVDMS